MNGSVVNPTRVFWVQVAPLVLFGVVFGYVEAAAVVYIRAVYEPIHQRLYPELPADDLFPLLSEEQWSQQAPPSLQRPTLELGRELGTVLLVGIIAWTVSRNRVQGLAAFLLAFGVWDLAYYLWLHLLLGWPHSLWDWDLIFVAPLPWVGPVLAPLAAALVLVLGSILFFWREAVGRPLQPRSGHWIALTAGVLAVLAAFWWNFRAVLATGSHGSFPWLLLLLGLVLGLSSFLQALRMSGQGAASTKG